MNDDLIISAAAEVLTDKPKGEITLRVIDLPQPPRYPFIDWMLNKRDKTTFSYRTMKIYPCKVGNMYRVAGKALEVPDLVTGESLISLAITHSNHCLPIVNYITACVIQNSEKEPNPDLLKLIWNNFDVEDLQLCLIPSLEGHRGSEISRFYGINQKDKGKGKAKVETEAQARARSLPHSVIGGIVKYFKLSINDILWQMSWENLILYMGSIPSNDPEDHKPPIEVRDAADIF